MFRKATLHLLSYREYIDRKGIEKMIKNEWQNLLHNKILLIVLIAIVAIPTIYTTLFLGSMWDPYGQLEQLPVAVVNEDKEVVYYNEKLDVGSRLVLNLKENDSLKFDFVNSSIARKRLEDGYHHSGKLLEKCFYTIG